MFHKEIIRIGTRKSALALAQTKLVGDAVKNSFPHIKIEYVLMNTIGDKRLDISLQEIGGKGLFTKELEEALIKGDIDLAIHSAKDLPLEFDNRLKLMPVLKRGAVRDVLVVKNDYPVDLQIGDLPCGFRIGTSSKRRSEQAMLLNHNVKIVPIRGNVLTRIGKIFSGDTDGVILARAGLDRLLADTNCAGECDKLLQKVNITDIKETDILPAPAQGILCGQYASDYISEVLKKIQDEDCNILFNAERKYLSVLEADCHTSAGIYIKKDRDNYSIKAYFEGKYQIAYSDSKGLFDMVENTANKLKRKNVK